MPYVGKTPTVGNFVKLDSITTSATDATTTGMRWQWAWRGALWVTEEGRVKEGLD